MPSAEGRKWRGCLSYNRVRRPGLSLRAAFGRALLCTWRLRRTRPSMTLTGGRIARAHLSGNGDDIEHRESFEDHANRV